MFNQLSLPTTIWLIFLFMWNRDLEIYVNEIFEQCQLWGLKINLEKTKHINMRNTRESKFLSLTINNKLTLHRHISEKINSSYYLIRFLSELKQTQDIPNRKNISLYKTLIRSILEYAHVTLVSAADCQINSLEIIKNKTLKAILNKLRNTHIVELHNYTEITLQVTGVCPLGERIKRLAKIQFKKALENNKHPIHENIPNFTHNKQMDRLNYKKTIYNKLLNL